MGIHNVGKGLNYDRTHLDLRTNALRHKGDRAAQVLLQSRSDRGQGVLLVRLAVRAAQVADQHNRLCAWK